MQFSSALRKATTLGIGLIAATSLILVGCVGGGGGSTTPASSSLGGVSAVGYPIVGGTVQVKCASGHVLNSTTTLAVEDIPVVLDWMEQAQQQNSIGRMALLLMGSACT